jgi:tripartite-type tricarboxylate transporter receptor subunit TctC
MPPAVVAKLSGLISEIARSPEIKQKLLQQGWQVVGSTAEGLASRVKLDTAQLGAIISQRAIKVE